MKSPGNQYCSPRLMKTLSQCLEQSLMVSIVLQRESTVLPTTNKMKQQLAYNNLQHPPVQYGPCGRAPTSSISKLLAGHNNHVQKSNGCRFTVHDETTLSQIVQLQ